jgi:hypothetical protein
VPEVQRPESADTVCGRESFKRKSIDSPLTRTTMLERQPTHQGTCTDVECTTQTLVKQISRRLDEYLCRTRESPVSRPWTGGFHSCRETSQLRMQSTTIPLHEDGQCEIDITGYGDRPKTRTKEVHSREDGDTGNEKMRDAAHPRTVDAAQQGRGEGTGRGDDRVREGIGDLPCDRVAHGGECCPGRA